MSDNIDELKNMLISFRVSELQMLLGYAGKNKSGKKNELQQRALELLRLREHPIQQKIRDLYNSTSAPQTSGATLSKSPGLPELTAAVPNPPISTNMPQQPGAVPRTTAAVPPYSIDARQMTNRQTTMYTQNLAQNLYQPYPQYANPKQQNIISAFPIHPDVKFRRLPFYDIITDLLKPSTLVPSPNQRLQEGSFFFHLTPQQATDIAVSRDIRPGVKCDYIKQVQLRFCLLETTCEQDDCFPPQVVVKVNNKLCPLPNPIPTNKPGVEPKRPPRPVNITQMVKLSPTVANQITVSWGADYGRAYAMTVALVHKLTSSDLLQRLKNKGAKHADHTRALIKEKLTDDGDCEIATTSLRVSLMCPLGKMRMSTPCRPITCKHLQCFDGSLFLQMNERKPTWNCPVCDKPALYDNLVIDGYFQEVLNSATLPSECSEIQLLKDGSWSSQSTEKKVVKTEKATANISTIAIDDSIEIIEDNVEIVSSKVTATSSTDKVKEPEKKKKEVVDLTVSDSDDDEPLAKRRPPPKPDSTIKFGDNQTASSSSSQSRATPGAASVTSSGYPASPSVINLDSPSPPPRTSPQPPQQQTQQPAQTQQQSTSQQQQQNVAATSQQQQQQPPSCMMAGLSQTSTSTTTNGGATAQPPNTYGMSAAPGMPFLDLETDASLAVNFPTGY